MIHRKITVTIGSTEYQAELARVKRTHLGNEDHGILSINVEFEGLSGSWGQGTGHYFADRPNRMFPWVKHLLGFFGCTWEQIVGMECLVLREEYAGQIVGLASKSSDEYVLFQAIREEVEVGEDRA